MVRLIGVNNRNLRTFKVDLDTTVKIADEIRKRGLALGKRYAKHNFDIYIKPQRF